MRKLTFAGYLKRYVKTLSLGNTNSIVKLVNEVPRNHRLQEPLLLYALSIGKTDYLLRIAAGSILYTQYKALVQEHSLPEMVKALEEKATSLDSNYHKLYNSYLSRRNLPETNNDTKMLMHNKIKCLQAQKKISNYRIYTDLRLNPGNINSFLKNSEVKKISLETARAIIGYLENA